MKTENEELDNQVAEKVMKWHKKEAYGTWDWVNDNDRPECGVPDDGFEDDEDFNLLFWHPSDSMLWAWDVFEEMSKHGIVKVSNGDGDSCDCDFFPWGELIEPNWYPAHTTENSYSLAISKAAIIAVTKRESE